jgi:hypothetical protein
MIDSQSTTTTLTSTPKTEADRKRQELTRLIFQGVVLALVIGLATTYRLYNLTEVGYNSDEAVYSGQAAAIAKVPILTEHFPIFRAHPLLFQFSLAVVYTFGANEWLGRALSAIIGIATVLLTYALGKRLYGFQVGVLAALFLALMPYHVVPTRQVLLDGSMAFAATLTLFLMARFSATERPVLLYAAGAAMGLTVLAKETGILMVGAIYAFIALTPKVRVRLRDLIISLGTMGFVVAVYPFSVSLAGAGGGGKTQQYLVWQLFRRPNHTWDFYPTVVPPAMGFLVIAAALVGLYLLRSDNSWREKLLFLWILVPVAFFQLWPTKGFQYLLPAAAPMAILAARTLTLWPRKPLRLGQFKVPQPVPGLVYALITALTLAIPSWASIHPPKTDTFLAGSGGIPGGRELGEWIQSSTPEDATFMTIGPSMANIIKYYGHQQAYGVSVSPHPRHRNPSYTHIINPDFQIRMGELQYLVWDSFSAQRTSFFSEKLLFYANKYHGRVVHTETVPVPTPDGGEIDKPVIIVYEVRP